MNLMQMYGTMDNVLLSDEYQTSQACKQCGVSHLDISRLVTICKLINI
jgi:hypothetical protein